MRQKIILKELKEYLEVKRQRPLFGTTVFYYRSDNLSDEQPKAIKMLRFNPAGICCLDLVRRIT